MLSLVGIAVACGWGYSKYHYAKSVADEVDALAPFANEKVELIAVEASEKHFTLQLSIAGIHPEAENIQALKAYYDDVASEPVPDRFLSLLDALDAAESSSKAGSK